MSNLHHFDSSLLYDVVVIGGGHAGIEAATAAHRLGSLVVLVTLQPDDLGQTSCNPAVGGMGKSHLVSEIDALDGLMGTITDRSGIQFRMLNATKGPAVRALRAQVDRNLYRDNTKALLAKDYAAMGICYDRVIDIDMDAQQLRSVHLENHGPIRTKSVVVCTGTFLGGVMHIGADLQSGGRFESTQNNQPGSHQPADAHALAKKLRDAKLPMGRLKTGTPPRIAGDSIDRSVMQLQPGDASGFTMSSMGSVAEHPQQRDCLITRTNSKVHDIVRAHLHESAIHYGNITGVGPRYCPSLEDKIQRFADKSSHQIFLEPETLAQDVYYPNGISTSLPKAVQDRFVRSIEGLEQANILRYGYAVEYDYLDPKALDATLQSQHFPGLFTAGQINGTTGYEEAAAQGLMAGWNAVRWVRGQSAMTLKRSESYIAVMLDDLVRLGVSEPYRMFTSRAEYRLQLRQDNAPERLTQIGMDEGLVRSHRAEAFVERSAERDALGQWIAKQKIGEGDKKLALTKRMTQTDFNSEDLRQLTPEEFSDHSVYSAWVDQRYSGYVRRQVSELERVNSRSDYSLLGLDFQKVHGLTSELKEKMHRIKPATLHEASLIQGVTPVALAILSREMQERAAV